MEFPVINVGIPGLGADGFMFRTISVPVQGMIDCRAVIGTFHDGYLPEKMSCIVVSGDSAIVTAIKKREDSSENIVRLYEANGEDSRVKIKLFGKEIESCMSHNEIKTLTEQGEELNLIEW